MKHLLKTIKKYLLKINIFFENSVPDLATEQFYRLQQVVGGQLDAGVQQLVYALRLGGHRLTSLQLLPPFCLITEIV